MVPFYRWTSIALWEDADRSAAAVAELSPGDVEGYRAYNALFARIRRALRAGDRDVWVGDAPDRAELEELLAGDTEAIEVVFEASIADVVERHVSDERLRTALHGQGIIGTYAGPRDPGTAAVHLMHASGTLEGVPGAWGYVDGRDGPGVVCARRRRHRGRRRRGQPASPVAADRARRGRAPRGRGDLRARP